METRICTKCKQEKSIDVFYKNASQGDGLHNECKICADTYKKQHQKNNPTKYSEYSRKYRQNNLEKSKESQRKYRTKHAESMLNKSFKYRFNITLDDYNKMSEKQNGVCAICGEVNGKGRRLAVDHNHITGEIRGLLCMKCNVAVGKWGEDMQLFEKTLSYLKENYENGNIYKDKNNNAG